MKIPFALHRRIPMINRMLEQRDALRRRATDLAATLDAMAAERDLQQRAHEASQARANDLQQQLERRPPERDPKGPNIISIPDFQFGAEAKTILCLLRPMDVVGVQMIRKGREWDGGYVMADTGLQNATAYSLGISTDVSWDLDMADAGCQVFQYDHTIDALPDNHPNFHWFKQGIAAKSTPDDVMASLGDLIIRNGHAAHRDIILKMDIENFEWEVFESLDQATMEQFSQIVLELHQFCTKDYVNRAHDVEHIARRRRVLQKINETHQCVNVHANNIGTLGIVGGVMLPDVIEATFVRRSDHTFLPTTRLFPSELDTPCRPDSPDFFFGAIGALPAPTLGEPVYQNQTMVVID
jgi:hypothetical protein